MFLSKAGVMKGWGFHGRFFYIFYLFSCVCCRDRQTDWRDNVVTGSKRCYWNSYNFPQRLSRVMEIRQWTLLGSVRFCYLKLYTMCWYEMIKLCSLHFDTFSWWSKPIQSTHKPLQYWHSLLPRVLERYETLMTLERVYGGQKINGQRLHYFNPHMSFWSCIKSTNNNLNI